MKITTIIIAIGLCWGLSACKDTLLDVTDFEVNTQKSSYKVGETVTFNFEGNPDLIYFYSGENGKRFENKDRIKVSEGKPILNFLSFRQNGSQNNTIGLYVSSDFAGIYDSTNIKKARWVDITNRAIFSTGSDNTASGSIDLSDQVSGSKPLYIAFRYNNPKNTTGPQRTWTIKGLTLNNVLPDGSSYPIYASNTAGWVSVNVKNPLNQWVLSSTQVQIVGGATNADENDDWVIARPFEPSEVAPDFSTPLKNMSTYLPNYNYIFTKAGTYNVTFIGATETKYGRRETVRQIQITVTL
jgi:hypothetical protein